MLGNNDYLKQRAGELGLDREQVLERLQAALNQWYPNQARAISFNDGVLRLVTPNASVASDLRLRQVELLRLLGKEDAVRLSVTIQTM